MKLLKNMGSIDCIFWFIIVIIVIIFYFMGIVIGFWGIVLLLFVVVIIFIGISGFCFLYFIFGWNICGMNK